jgi:hypothetical protein
MRRARALPGEDGTVFAHLFDHGSNRAHRSEHNWQLFKILGKPRTYGLVSSPTMP